MTISIAPSIATQNSFFEREIRLFPIRKVLIQVVEWLLNSYLKKLNKLLDETYTDMQGVLVVIKDYSQEEAKRDLPAVRKAINLLVTYNGYLAQVEYFKSTEVKEKIDLVISALYDIEIQLKMRAFLGQPRSAAQTEFVSALASHSSEALNSTFSN